MSLLKVFKYNISESPKKLIVDIVSHNGSRWNKISARNPRALTLNSSGEKIYQSDITLSLIKGIFFH